MSEFISLFRFLRQQQRRALRGAVSHRGYGQGVRTTGTALKELELNISDCDGILVTHEHSDHVKGLSTFLKKYPPPVTVQRKRWNFWTQTGSSRHLRPDSLTPGREEDIGVFGVKAFPTSHDVPVWATASTPPTRRP